MFYCLCGEERYQINKKVEELIRELGIDNIIKYDMDEVKFIDIISEVNYIDLFNERKLVIVSNFSFKSLSSKEEDFLLKFIENEKENVIIVKCNEKLDDRKKIIKVLKDKKCVFEFNKLKYSTLENYVFDLIKEKGYKISLNDVKKLVKKLEYNSDIVFNEIEKLMMYKLKEKTITLEDIENVVNKNYEKEMFSFSSAVMNKETGKVFDSYKILIDMKIEPTVLIDYLSKQFRTLYQIKNMNTTSTYEIAKKLSINEYVVKVLYNNLNTFKNEEILDIIEKLFIADEQIKIYGYDKYKTFENFLINM